MANVFLTNAEVTISHYFSAGQKAAIESLPVHVQRNLYADVIQKAFSQMGKEHVDARDDELKLSQESEKRIKDIVDSMVLHHEDHQQEIPNSDNPHLASITSMLTSNPNWRANGFPNRWKLISNTLFKRDPEICRSVHEWVQERLTKASVEVVNSDIRSIYVRNLLAYIPFFSPELTPEWQLPMGENGALVPYRIERIELMPRYLGSPLVAYGLIPTDNRYPPFFVLKGTSYPADDGFFFGLMSDINPFAAPGGHIFHLFAKRRIESWLKEHTGKCKGEVVGVSLGGCLALQTASYLPQYLGRVSAFNSPAVTPRDVQAWKRNSARLHKEEKPTVNVYLQDGDPISIFVGQRWADEDWTLRRGYSRVDSIFQSHAAAFTADREACIITEDTTRDSNRWERKLWPMFQNGLFIPVFLVGIAFCILFCIVHNMIWLARTCFNAITTRLRRRERNITLRAEQS